MTNLTLIMVVMKMIVNRAITQFEGSEQQRRNSISRLMRKLKSLLRRIDYRKDRDKFNESEDVTIK